MRSAPARDRLSRIGDFHLVAATILAWSGSAS
jgi:hypothetical protein